MVYLLYYLLEGFFSVQTQIEDIIQQNIFRENIVFGSMPIGDPADISLNAIEHINKADIIVVENHRQFSRLISCLNYLPVNYRPNMNPQATIYQYNLESNPERANEVMNEIVKIAGKNVKIFIVSDEGSSVFLEPMSELKSKLMDAGFGYQVLPGPNSVISAVVNGRHNVHEFYFAGNFEHLPNKEKTFKEVQSLRKPTVFILRAIGLQGFINTISQEFSESWDADFQMNLSMDTETHVYGTFDEIRNFVYTNNSLWDYEEETKKIIITLYPKEYRS